MLFIIVVVMIKWNYEFSRQAILLIFLFASLLMTMVRYPMCVCKRGKSTGGSFFCRVNITFRQNNASVRKKFLPSPKVLFFCLYTPACSRDPRPQVKLEKEGKNIDHRGGRRNKRRINVRVSCVQGTNIFPYLFFHLSLSFFIYTHSWWWIIKIQL